MEALHKNRIILTKSLAAEVYRTVEPRWRRVIRCVGISVLMLIGWLCYDTDIVIGCLALSLATGWMCGACLKYLALKNHLEKAKLSRETAFYDSSMTVTFQDGTTEQTGYAAVSSILDYGRWLVLQAGRNRILLSKDGETDGNDSRLIALLQKKTQIDQVKNRRSVPVYPLATAALAILLLWYLAQAPAKVRQRRAEALLHTVLSTYEQDYNNGNRTSLILTAPYDENDTLRLYSGSDREHMNPSILYAAYLEAEQWKVAELSTFPSQTTTCGSGTITVYRVCGQYVLVMEGYDDMVLSDQNGVPLYRDTDAEARPLHAGLVMLPSDTEVYLFYAGDELMQFVLPEVEATEAVEGRQSLD